jgi:hypothetical protein
MDEKTQYYSSSLELTNTCTKNGKVGYNDCGRLSNEQQADEEHAKKRTRSALYCLGDHRWN